MFDTIGPNILPPFLNEPIKPIVVEILSLWTVLAARAIDDGRTRAWDIPINNAGIINIVLSNDNDTKNIDKPRINKPITFSWF